MSGIRFLTAGESHGPALTAVLEGIPAGLKIDEDFINAELARRQTGYGRGGRMKIERDKIKILSGVRFGETLGSPITLEVENRDFANWREKMAAFGAEYGDKVTAARPGHADLAGALKYARRDVRDILERSSARETTMRVAVGAVCKIFLAACGMKIKSHVVKIGGVAADESKFSFDEHDGADSELNCADKEAEAKMKARIDEARANGDTVGGAFVVAVTGAPVGLGSHIQWDKRLDARLAAALMSIQAIKAVEIGAGAKCAELLGSEIHDEIWLDENKIPYRKTNRAGGIEGGMTNGETITVRAVMKPIPTLMKPLHSINIATKEAVLAAKERSDVCAVPAASVVGEAMMAIVLADATAEKFGGDAMSDVLAAMKSYGERIKRW